MKANGKRSFTKLIEAASLQVAKTVVERAKASGTPLIVWANGKVQEVDPDQWNKGGRRAVRK